MLENLRSKLYYKIVGIISWILAPLALYHIIYAQSPNGFASLGAGFLSVILFIGLVIIYSILLLVSVLDCKRIVNRTTNKYFDTGYIIGFATIIYFIIFFMKNS